MTLRPQLSLSIAGGDDALSSAHPAQSGGCFPAQFPRLGRDEVGYFMGFEVAPHIFDRVEFGRIGGQPLNLDATLGGGDEVLDEQASVNRCAIPDNQQLSGNVLPEVLEEFDDLRAFDAPSMNLEVEPPQRQAANDREAFPIKGFVQDGRFSARSPSANPCGPGAQSAFVDKDNGSPLLAGLFFKAGHSTRCHLRMAFSSRSTARRSGRWQLKPLAPSNRHT